MSPFRIVLIVLMLVTGCGQGENSKSQSPATHFYGHSIFDVALTNSTVRARAKAVEEDRQDDIHKSVGQGTLRPVSWNDSRRIRERALAKELLSSIQPTLKRMSVTDLVAVMKLYPVYSAEAPSGVAYWLYSEGNQAVINEIKSRSAREMDALKPFARDKKFEVFINESYSEPLGVLCREILKSKGVF